MCRRRFANCATGPTSRPAISPGANTYFIGLLYDNPSAGYISELLIGALNRCRKSGYHLVVESCESAEQDWESAIGEMLQTSNFDGVIIPPPVCDNIAVLDAVDAAQLPHVRISPGRSA